MKTMTRTSFAVPARSTTFGAVMAKLVTAWQVARERRALSHLDARTLQDIGMTEEAANFEASRPFWDLPSNR